MKLLNEKFRKNGLQYWLIQRNVVVSMYGICGTYTDNILHYEVCKIRIRNDKYGYREALPSNEQFGKERSQAILKYEDALKYFDEFTSAIKLSIEVKSNDKSGILNSSVDSDTHQRTNEGTVTRILTQED